MYMSLEEAPANRELLMGKVVNPILESRLRRMGLYEGCSLTRLDQEVNLHPVRVKGPLGEALLAGGMAAKVIIHHDDGHKTPIIEMLPGEQGHIEGLTSGTGLEKALRTLGMAEGDRIEMVRKIPPMEYTALVKGKGRLRLTESVAVKIWGEMQGRKMQFAISQKGREFNVLELLGGNRAQEAITSLSILPGSVLILEKVSQAQNVGQTDRDQIVVAGKDGLRLFLRPDQAASIYVMAV